MPKGNMRGGRVASSYRAAASKQRKARDSQLEAKSRTKVEKAGRIGMAARDDANSRANLREANREGMKNQKYNKAERERRKRKGK